MSTEAVVRLESYLLDEWQAGEGIGQRLINPTTGAEVATVSSAGLDLGQALEYGRLVGGASLMRMSFAERGELLGALGRAVHAARDALIEVERVNGGCTRKDAKFDIDGASGTLMYYAELSKELGEEGWARLDGPAVNLGRSARLQGQHVWVPRPGVAVLINAFNFPCWGLAEKLACALLAGMPVLCKPATATAWATHAMVRAWADQGLLPAGVLQLLCGSVGDLLDHLKWSDVIAFTGSAQTAARIRQHPRVAELGLPLNVEADSVNSAVLLPECEPATYDTFLRDVHLELTQKAGQKCTAFRRIFVPAAQAADVVADLGALLARSVVGDPADAKVTVGPLATVAQRDAAIEGVQALLEEATVVWGDPAQAEALRAQFGPDSCFVPPLVLQATAPFEATKVHEIEVFGPVVTVLPYDNLSGVLNLVRKGQGSLVAALYGDDLDELSSVTQGLLAWHGRVVVVDARVAERSIAPGTVMPHLMHGGPGRAGEGCELGGLRGLAFYQQRCAIQGSGPLIPRLLES